MTAGTIITGLALLAIVAAIVVKLARDTRNGRQCAGCGGAGKCPASLTFREKVNHPPGAGVITKHSRCPARS